MKVGFVSCMQQILICFILNLLSTLPIPLTLLFPQSPKLHQQMDNEYKLHFCTDLPIQYRYRKIKAVISALGVKVVDVPRETFADLRGLSPMHTLPLLETSEGNFSSSNTIIRYLAAKCDYKLYGKDSLYERALIDQWLDLTQCDFDTCSIALNVYLDGKEVDIETVTQDAQKFLAHLNKHLKNKKYVVGNQLSIADFAIAATIGPVLANMYGEEERKKYSILAKWYHDIAQQNKEIEPKELPKKIHKKFEKKKEKGDKPEKQETKQSKGEKKEKAKSESNKDKESGEGKEKKEKKDKKKEGTKQEKKETAGEVKAEKDEKKSKKNVAKSIVVFNVKVYDQEQDLKKLAEKIKAEISPDGLVWNNEVQIKPVAFGMNMLELGCVIEDSKVSIEEDVFSKILGWETEVQSVDTISFQKL